MWQLSLCLRQYLLHNFLSGQVSLAGWLHHWNTTSFLLLLPVRLMEDAIIPEVTVIVSRKLINFDVLNYNFTNKDWHMTLAHQANAAWSSEFLFKFCFHFLWEGFSGHDLPCSSVGYNQVPFTAAPQSHQPSTSKYTIFQVLLIVLAKTVSCFNLCTSRSKRALHIIEALTCKFIQNLIFVLC